MRLRRLVRERETPYAVVAPFAQEHGSGAPCAQQQVAQHSSGEGADGPSASWAFESCAALAPSRNECVKKALRRRAKAVLVRLCTLARLASGILAF